MIGYIVLAVSLSLPLLLGLSFKVGSPNLFFSIMAGELLARYFGHDLEAQLGSHLNIPVASYGEPAILLAPLFLTALFLRKSVSERKLILHILPLIVTGIVLTAFVLPMLPVGLQESVVDVPFGSDLLNLNDMIIGFVVLTQLVSFWILQRYKFKGRARKKE